MRAQWRSSGTTPRQGSGAGPGGGDAPDRFGQRAAPRGKGGAACDWPAPAPPAGAFRADRRAGGIGPLPGPPDPAPVGGPGAAGPVRRRHRRRPRAVFLDEPTAAMDVDGPALVLADDPPVRPRGTDVVFATHHLAGGGRDRRPGGGRQPRAGGRRRTRATSRRSCRPPSPLRLRRP